MKKILFTYWHQGLDGAPPVVRLCLDRMHRLHPSWDIRVLDERSARSYVEEIPLRREVWERLGLAHRSDLLRTHLLIRHGGVWADPTVYFAEPLEQRIVPWSESGFFVFTHPGPGRLISNWFLAAEEGHPLLRAQLSALCRYWSLTDYRNLDESPPRWVTRVEKLLTRFLNRKLTTARLWVRPTFARRVRIAPYMVYHFQFCDLVRSDASCKRHWRDAGRRSALEPHVLLRHGLLEPLTPTVRRWIDEPTSPVFKLTWKLPAERVPEGSVLAYLQQRSDVAAVSSS